ncbi:hypothetical protein BGZ72_006865 [Mortierella alpina]|nr:hypothetical protein BGZ72_006865 [Mortierella alpina]
MTSSCHDSAPADYQVNYGVHNIGSPMANSGGDITGSVLYGSNGVANSFSCLPQFMDISPARKHQGVPHVAESIALEQLTGEAVFQPNYSCNSNYTYSSKPKLQGEYDDASEYRRRASAPAVFAINQLMSSPPGSSDGKASLLSSTCSFPSMNSNPTSLSLSSSCVNSTVALSSPPTPAAQQYLVPHYAYVNADQQQHHNQQQPFPHHLTDHLHPQQQQQQQQQQQLHQHTGFVGSYPHDPTPSHTQLSANGFQGVACSDSNNPHQSSALAPSWNDRIASPTGTFPIDSTPDHIAWTNFHDMLQQQQQQQQQHPHATAYPQMMSSSGPIMANDLQSVPRQSNRIPRQRKAQQQPLHISTSPNYPAVGFSPYRDDPSTMHTFLPHPHTATATMMHPHSFPWGLVSPVESCIASGASTPSFASHSPSLSFTGADINSNGSSRSTSPLLSQPPHQSHPMKSNDRNPTEGRSSFEPYPPTLAHSRKSSVSSIHSNTSAKQRRASNARDSAASTSSSSASVTNVPSSTHRCPTCSQCFAGPAVLVRHVESIHKKLLWCCIGCKSNLSRRDAVTRHINLSPMDSICRTVGRIGQIKTLKGAEVHFDISSYRAKPLDEVMSRMGKKISSELKKEIDRAKGVSGLSEELLDRLVETEEGCDEEEEEEETMEEVDQEEEDSKAGIKLEDFDDEPHQKRRWS